MSELALISMYARECSRTFVPDGILDFVTNSFQCTWAKPLCAFHFIYYFFESKRNKTISCFFGSRYSFLLLSLPFPIVGKPNDSSCCFRLIIKVGFIFMFAALLIMELNLFSFFTVFPL